jgi:hypothetical protein
MGCSRSYVYESFDIEPKTPVAMDYLQESRLLRLIGEYFEGPPDRGPIDPGHCKNCSDIYKVVRSIELIAK